jgi:MFS family permease
MGFIILLQAIALAFGWLAVKGIPDHRPVHMKSSLIHTFNVFSEMKSWGVISSRIAPFLILNFMIIFVDAAYWTVGALLGMGLLKNNELDWLPLTLYTVPMVLGSIALSKLPFKEHKKKYSQLATLFGGIVLGLLFLVNTGSYLVLALIFISSLCFSMARPFHYAVMSDLLARLGRGKDDLVGIQNATGSFAYVLGPIFAGFIAEISSYQFAFASFGLLTAVVAGILLVTTPRKLRLPEKQLNAIYDEAQV